jgi:hypothetical protein
MTPLQQHGQELRSLMERAGLVVEPMSFGELCGKGPGGVVDVRFASSRGRHYASAVYVPDHTTATAYHPDPRVALRACLEMAGLLTPPIRTEFQQSADGPRWRVVVTAGTVTSHSEWRDGWPGDDARFLVALGEAIGAVDRPPMTDNELERWLTERHGQPKLIAIHRIHWESANTWHDPTRPDSMSWWSLYGGERVWTDARTCGLRLWAAERFPERP